MEGIGSVAVIGAGKMGEIMAAGMVRSGLDAGSIRIFDVDAERLKTVATRHGLASCSSNLDAIHGVDAILLAVKPQVVAEVLGELGSSIDEDQLVVSIAAGVSTGSIEAALAQPRQVVRAMPNAASQVGAGITAICPGTLAGEASLMRAERLLEGVGPVIHIAERYMDAVTAVSGSGPAYFALFAEAMIDAAVTAGLPRATAARLVAQTMLGAARMLTDGGMAPVEIREAVMSPAGTTAMGLRELERGSVRAAVLNAVQAAMARSAALAGPEDG